MAPRFLLVSANAGATRLQSDLARFGGEVARATARDLAGMEPGELASTDCVIVEAVGRGGELPGLSEAVKKAGALGEKPLLAVVGEQDLAGLDWPAGVDDLIVVPYRQTELQARLNRALRRSEVAVSPNALTTGELTLDPDSYEVRVRGVHVDLTLKEYELLRHLMTYPGRVFTREQLLSSVWDYEYFGGTRTVDVHIRRLRAKLGDAGERHIDTVRGVGYVFRP